MEIFVSWTLLLNISHKSISASTSPPHHRRFLTGHQNAPFLRKIIHKVHFIFAWKYHDSSFDHSPCVNIHFLTFFFFPLRISFSLVSWVKQADRGATMAHLGVHHMEALCKRPQWTTSIWAVIKRCKAYRNPSPLRQTIRDLTLWKFRQMQRSWSWGLLQDRCYPFVLSCDNHLFWVFSSSWFHY